MIKILVIHYGLPKNLKVLKSSIERRGWLAVLINAELDELIDILPDRFDAIVLLNGPYCALERFAYPFIMDELSIIKRAIDCKKKVLAIDKGIHLLAKAYEIKILESSTDFSNEEAGLSSSTLFSLAESLWHETSNGLEFIDMALRGQNCIADYAWLQSIGSSLAVAPPSTPPLISVNFWLDSVKNGLLANAN